MTDLLNFAVSGLLFGLLSAAVVELLSIRVPRVAAIVGTALFPLVAIAPLLGFAGDVALPIDDRRIDTLTWTLCTVIAMVLVAREIVGHLQAARGRGGWTLAPRELRDSIGVEALYVQAGEQAATLGLFRRSIVIPSHGVDRAVLLHERDHHRWHDPLAGAVRRMIRALFWFNPGLLLLDRASGLATELAADAAAIAGATQSERSAFATLLVSAARAYPPANAFGARTARDLETRVRTLIGCAASTRAVLAVAVIVGAVAMLPFVPHFVAADQVIIRHVIRIG